MGRAMQGRFALLAAGLVLAGHACLLAWGALRHSPTWDEVGYLPAGISHWRFGRFDLCAVNPPLVRMMAAAPMLCANVDSDWTSWSDRVWRTSWHAVGADFVRANGSRSFWLYTLARWACIPLSLAGAVVCFLWARELYGAASGVLALCLWCFCPNILGHGQLITPDVGTTAAGLLASYVFWKWLRRADWACAVGLGLVLGLAQLTKVTWLVLFVLWPYLWVWWRLGQGANSRGRWLRAQGAQLVAAFVIAVYVVNAGYGFEGSFRRLGEYRFVSSALAGPQAGGEAAWPWHEGNRFAQGWLGLLAVPLPSNYVLGLDAQRWLLEGPRWSYLRGQWRTRGWWYYYLYGLAIKVPLGTWLLLVLALAAGTPNRERTSWRDEVVLLAPLAAVLLLVSSQTSLSKHVRYALPVLPYAFIWCSRVATAAATRRKVFLHAAAAACCWSLVSSLWIYPHSLSYFNELVGGPRGGHVHLLDSNIDWGQDLLYLKRWLERYPEARPLRFAYFLRLVDPRIAGIEYTVPRMAAGDAPASGGTGRGGKPVWYAISINRLRSQTGEYECFLGLPPAAMAGYSIYVYRVSEPQDDGG